MQFGAYTIVKKIGAGGMGAVYEATHTDLHKRVAIKTLLPSLTESEDIRQRFIREGQAAARIRHQHVVDIHHVGQLDGITYLVMEYLEGENLSDYLRIKGQTSLEEILDIMLPVCSAIHAAHEAGIVHRDLKPANVFITRTRTGELFPKVLDFGISKIVTNQLGETLTNAGEILGTPFYMSPEQASGERQLDARSDQYSLGIILYQYLTGRKPFDGNSMYNVLHRIVQGSFEPPRAVNPALDEAIEEAILRAMSRSPDDRFPTVRDLGSMLLPFARARTQAVWGSEFERTQTLSGPPPRKWSSSNIQVQLPQPESRPFAPEPSLAFAPTLSRTSSGIKQEEQKKPWGKVAMFGGAAGILALGATLALRPSDGEDKSPKQEPPPSQAQSATPPAGPATFHVLLSAEPKTTVIELDGQVLGQGQIDKELTRDGREHILKLTAEGHATEIVHFKDVPPSQNVVLTKLPVTASTEPPKARKDPPIRSVPDSRGERTTTTRTPSSNPAPNADPVNKGANNALIIQ